MTNRRLAVTGLAVFAALSLSVAGCKGGTGADATPTGSATQTAPQQLSAVEELSAAARKLNNDTVKVAMEMTGVTASGSMDPAGPKAKMTMKMSAGGEKMTIDIIVLGDDVYIKIPNVTPAGKWMHVDKASIKPGSSLDVMPADDPAGANNLIKGVVDAERTGDRAFKGTLDITKSPTADDSVKALGDKAKALPFTAKVDDQGRLIELVVDMTAISPLLQPLTTTYSDFGTAVTVEKPAPSQVAEAPAAMLDALAG